MFSITERRCVMKVYKEFIKRIWPKLGKNELRLCMILLDVCNKPECSVDKVAVYKHPLFTNTLKQHFGNIAKNIVGNDNKIICGNYTTEPEQKHTLFNEIKIDTFKINVKIDETVLNYFKRNGQLEIDTGLFEKFGHVYETKFILWFKTWENEKERKINIDILKTYLNKPYKSGEFTNVIIKPLLQKMLINGIEIHLTKIQNENDRRFVDLLHFKVIE